MAYMHESVHICHLDFAFFVDLHDANSYHANFIFGMVTYDLTFKKDCFFVHESYPEAEKNDKKYLMNLIFL